MQLRFLGTGTSSGIPVLGCSCPTCLSQDPKDHRFRTAVLLSCDDKNILIDAGPEIRLALVQARISSLEAILLTHEHYDHVAGMDDFRPLTWTRSLPVFALPRCLDALKSQLPYLFDPNPLQIGGGLTQFQLHPLTPSQSFSIAGLDCLPLSVLHGRLPILGFKIGNLAYFTDVKQMPSETIQALKGVDTLVLNCLRKKQHSTHLNLNEALALIKQIRPKRSYFVHMSHDLTHKQWETLLPPQVYVAYDGLEISIP